jgi:hypothetical protein
MRATLIAICIVLGTQPVGAEPDAAKADALFAHGRAAMKAGKLAEACTDFDDSQKLAPATPTLFNQADCREKNGQLATAWRLFTQAELATRGAVDVMGKKLHQTAVDRIAELAPRLSHVTVKVGAHPDGLTLRRDDMPWPPNAWNVPVPTDAGTYTFAARIGERDVWSETVTVAIAGDAAVVEVVLQPAARVPASVTVSTSATSATSAPVSATVTAPASADVQATAPAASASTLHAKLVTVGAGVLLGGALACDLWANTTYQSAKQMHSTSLWTSANDQLYVAQTMLIAGLAASAIATYLWVHERAEPRHTVAPMVGQGAAGVLLGGSW